MLGTTQLVNALVQRAGLARVLAVRVCGPATRGLPPLAGWPPALRAAVDGGVLYAQGGVKKHNHDGVCDPLELAERTLATQRNRNQTQQRTKYTTHAHTGGFEYDGAKPISAPAYEADAAAAAEALTALLASSGALAAGKHSGGSGSIQQNGGGGGGAPVAVAITGVFSPLNGEQEEALAAALRRAAATRLGAGAWAAVCALFACFRLRPALVASAPVRCSFACCTLQPAMPLHTCSLANSHTARAGVQLHITLSHRLGDLGFLERESGAILNAALQPLAAALLPAARRALAELGLSAPLLLTGNDGALLPAELAQEVRPRVSFSGSASDKAAGRQLTTLCKHSKADARSLNRPCPRAPRSCRFLRFSLGQSTACGAPRCSRAARRRLW